MPCYNVMYDRNNKNKNKNNNNEKQYNSKNAKNKNKRTDLQVIWQVSILIQYCYTLKNNNRYIYRYFF